MRLKVGIFLETVGNSSTDSKRRILHSFAEGVRKSEDRAIIVNKPEYRNCDIALIFGFYGQNLGYTQSVRKKVFKAHLARGKKCIFIDADPLKYAGTNLPKNQIDPLHYLRVSHTSVYPSDGYYFNEGSPSDRWDKISKEKNIVLKPYRKEGDHILICLNSDNKRGRGWSTRNYDADKWLRNTIKEIRMKTDFPIRLRFHPGGDEITHRSRHWKKFLGVNNITFSGGIIGRHPSIINNTTMLEETERAIACITMTSSSTIVAVINGVPIFTDNKDCLTYPVANHNYSKILTPKFPNRDQWLYNLAYSCWNCDEMKNGIVWDRFRSRLNDNGDYSKKKAQRLGVIP